MSRLNKDVVTGALFLAIALVFLTHAYGLPFGTWRRVGPGVFPTLVAALLALLGLGITLRGVIAGGPRARLFSHPQGLLAVLASIVVFGFTVRGAGLLPATALSTVAAACAMHPVRLGRMALYGVAAGAVCSGLFIKLLGMPVPVIGPWFGF